MLLLHHAGPSKLPLPLPTPLAACTVLLACVQYVQHDRTAGEIEGHSPGCPIVVKATTVRSAVVHSALSHSHSGEMMLCCNRQLCPLYATQKSREARRTTTRHDTTRRLSILLHPVASRLHDRRLWLPLSPLSIPTIPGVYLLIAVLLLPVDSSSCFRILVPNLRYQTLWPTAMKHNPPTHPQTDTHVQRRPDTKQID